jgi:hypothetical protein
MPGPPSTGTSRQPAPAPAACPFQFIAVHIRQIVIQFQHRLPICQDAPFTTTAQPLTR